MGTPIGNSTTVSAVAAATESATLTYERRRASSQTAPAAYAYYLVTSEADASQPAVLAFRQWLLEEAAPELAGDD